MRPLEAIRGVTFERAIAAPFCTRQLADLGARVIKFERPGTGDFVRNCDERFSGLSSHFVWTNRSKESITLDVKQAKAIDVVRKLLVFLYESCNGTALLVHNLLSAKGKVNRLHQQKRD